MSLCRPCLTGLLVLGQGKYSFKFKGLAQVALVVKNLPAVAGDRRDVGSILVLEDSLE